MTILLVAAAGGHLTQLFELAPRIEGSGKLWVTFDTTQSRSLLNGQPTVFIRAIEERDVVGVCRGASSANRLFNTLPVSAVFSTGSGIALCFLPNAAMRGIDCHYFESAARVGSLSLTGKLLQRVPGINLYRQYPHAAGDRWKYGGSVFEGFYAAPLGATEVRRIVVTVGSGVHGFRRLIEKLVSIIPKSVHVLWQTGSTPVEGLGIDARPFVPASELEFAIGEADAVISHAGCGSALTAFNGGKFPLLVSRQMQHGELVDSHQTEIADWLAGQELALHRAPETITFDDVAIAASKRVLRRAGTPPLKLATA